MILTAAFALAIQATPPPVIVAIQPDIHLVSASRDAAWLVDLQPIVRSPSGEAQVYVTGLFPNGPTPEDDRLVIWRWEFNCSNGRFRSLGERQTTRGFIPVGSNEEATDWRSVGASDSVAGVVEAMACRSDISASQGHTASIRDFTDRYFGWADSPGGSFQAQ